MRLALACFVVVVMSTAVANAHDAHYYLLNHEVDRDYDRDETNPIFRPFDLFSGTSAIRHNLDLHAVMEYEEDHIRTIEINSIEGITVAEVDWEALLADNPVPKIDPLAHYVEGWRVCCADFDPIIACRGAAVCEGCCTWHCGRVLSS